MGVAGSTGFDVWDTGVSLDKPTEPRPCATDDEVEAKLNSRDRFELDAAVIGVEIGVHRSVCDLAATRGTVGIFPNAEN